VCASDIQTDSVVSNMKFAFGLDSDIIYLNVAGTQVVVLNSLSAANELLDRRSLKYSSRCVDLPFP